MISKELLKGLEHLKIRGLVENTQTTALIRRFVVIRTPVKNHQLTLVWKTKSHTKKPGRD